MVPTIVLNSTSASVYSLQPQLCNVSWYPYVVTEFLVQFPNCSRYSKSPYSNTKLRPQVKQARLPTKMAVAMGLDIYYNKFSVTRTIYYNRN